MGSGVKQVGFRVRGAGSMSRAVAPGRGRRLRGLRVSFSVPPVPIARSLLIGAARYGQDMPRVPADDPSSSTVVPTNPDENTSPEAFRAFLDELLAGPEPELDGVGAAEALRAVRVDAQA